jgi:hypothetical protein
VYVAGTTTVGIGGSVPVAVGCAAEVPTGVPTEAVAVEMAAPPGVGVLGAGPPPGTAAAVWVSKAERTASIVACCPVSGLVVPLAGVPVEADEAERVQAPIKSAEAISTAVASLRIGIVAMGTSKNFVREPALKAVEGPKRGILAQAFGRVKQAWFAPDPTVQVPCRGRAGAAARNRNGGPGFRTAVAST